MTVLVETRADLTLDAARRVAWDGEGVELGATALAAMAEGRERLERIIEHDPDITIYGVTTGPGQLARKSLTPEQRERWAGMSPARIAASWGDPLPERVVRAIVLARLTNFVEGHAAVSPDIAQRVATMLDKDEMPMVPTKGQGGAGEILSLSHLFMGLAEEAEPAIKDVMCLVNGSPAATGLVTDAALVAEGRIDIAARVFALSFEAFMLRSTTSTRHSATIGTTRMIAGRSGACASWWRAVMAGTDAPIRRPSATASFRECWVRPGAQRRWLRRSRRNRSRR